jgi:hypothetical protein
MDSSAWVIGSEFDSFVDPTNIPSPSGTRETDTLARCADVAAVVSSHERRVSFDWTRLWRLAPQRVASVNCFPLEFAATSA